ncbi:BnaC04g56450D [Brassica napus]|uniref:Glutaredoxin domain-containing protein n=2 Tax=Brassica TaxID=3705 RepID=A0A3P6D3B0_BRAOL|nr:unnamed protein product [Brassica napus]CDY71728.1 BnaC04g56450D [Brassica napus]VDD14039.1 unnamed protein product [Brassica oleracea]
MDKVVRMSSEKGVVIFSKSSCCMSYAVQVLFQDLGVHPTVHEIDKDPDCREIEKALMRLGCSTPVPAVFVGGKLVALQENTPNSDGGSDGLQCRRTFVTDCRPISDENQKFEVVGIPSTISDGIPTKNGSSEFSDDFSTTFR